MHHQFLSSFALIPLSVFMVSLSCDGGSSGQARTLEVRSVVPEEEAPLSLSQTINISFTAPVERESLSADTVQLTLGDDERLELRLDHSSPQNLRVVIDSPVITSSLPTTATLRLDGVASEVGSPLAPTELHWDVPPWLDVTHESASLCCPSNVPALAAGTFVWEYAFGLAYASEGSLVAKVYSTAPDTLSFGASVTAGPAVAFSSATMWVFFGRERQVRQVLWSIDTTQAPVTTIFVADDEVDALAVEQDRASRLAVASGNRIQFLRRRVFSMFETTSTLQNVADSPVESLALASGGSLVAWSAGGVSRLVRAPTARGKRLESKSAYSRTPA